MTKTRTFEVNIKWTCEYDLSMRPKKKCRIFGYGQRHTSRLKLKIDIFDSLKKVPLHVFILFDAFTQTNCDGKTLNGLGGFIEASLLMSHTCCPNENYHKFLVQLLLGNSCVCIINSQNRTENGEHRCLNKSNFLHEFIQLLLMQIVDDTILCRTVAKHLAQCTHKSICEWLM